MTLSRKSQGVGVVTLAIALMLFGVAILVEANGGPRWFGSVLTLWPLLMVAVGVEILCATQIPEADAVRLDLVSLSILCLLVAGSHVIYSIAKSGVVTGINWHFRI